MADWLECDLASLSIRQCIKNVNVSWQPIILDPYDTMYMILKKKKVCSVGLMSILLKLYIYNVRTMSRNCNVYVTRNIYLPQKKTIRLFIRAVHLCNSLFCAASKFNNIFTCMLFREAREESWWFANNHINNNLFLSIYLSIALLYGFHPLSSWIIKTIQSSDHALLQISLLKTSSHFSK